MTQFFVFDDHKLKFSFEFCGDHFATIFLNKMRIIDVLLIAVLFLLMPKSNAEIPGCDFFDTVDISKAQRFSNGSYLYDGLLIPAHLTAKYDYKLLANDSKEEVASHVRGCACHLRPCIRFCCPQYQKMDSGVCYGDMSEDELNKHDPFVNVTLSDGSVVRRHFKDLIVQSDLAKPGCPKMYVMHHELPGNEFTLFEIAWGIPLLMTAITYIADQVVDDKNLRPRVGVGKNCWIYTGDMTVMIYFYGPMLLLIAFNITMFVLSALDIYNVKHSVNGFAKKQETNQQLNDQQLFTIFLRLFIIMGLSWSFEILSFLMSKQQAWAEALKVADYFNWSQGTIIFALFILKPSVLKLLIPGGRNLPGSHHNSRSKAARDNSTHTACEGSIADPNGV
ncbi:uncharacterized protein Dsimw501_GD26888 [Drosophila simulans]|uniref:G-protein coupled receptors family 2 profile 2 domain-containing protein n=1 Tax=Drosophila simulans TaxID=7240 RepID=A0A0J9RER2_DROSI|nr:uncharacterized protein Dsimw501_GD26888 [Drosophila simulans]